MSIPPQRNTTRNGGDAIENCRDFLRTGRCKYGASCKYFHPPNVQSGGGMKAPLDPSEPLYPVRPNEPICQYYMKHGSCKFGQACKFHHPPQASQQAILNGNTVVLMNVGRQGAEPPQYVLNSDPSVMLQLLPQRPDEPDCIYFLKNGRCKYGATCRYHHPLNYHKQRAEEQRRHHEQRRSHMTHQSTQYITTQQVHGLPHHTPVAVVNVEREGLQAYRSIPFTAQEGLPAYCVPAGSTVRTDLASPASSIASSYETAVEHMNGYGERPPGSWNRSGSVNSLAEGRIPHRNMLPHSASDGSLRRQRATSLGSSSEHAYYEANGGPIHRISSGTFRPERSSPMNHPIPVQGGPVSATNGETWAHYQRTRPPPATRRGRTREEAEGYTMMTSALLNLLDTTEEGTGENVSDEDNYHGQQKFSNANDIDPALFERLSLNGHPSRSYVPSAGNGGRSWSQSWQNVPSSQEINNMHGLHMMHANQQDQGSANDPNVGLYLP